MKAIFKLPARWLVISAGFALVALLSGCDGSSSTGTLPEANFYRIEGVLVNDLNAGLAVGDTARIAIKVERNDSVLADAAVTFGTTVLAFDRGSFPIDSVYSFSQGPTSFVESGAYGVGLVDSSLFADTLTLVAPDTFRIDFYTDGEDSLNVGGQEMQLTWTSAANAEGYVMSVVIEDSVYTGYGYTEYVTSQAPQTTIPPDAFRLESGIGGIPDTGWYHIFVYGYTGNPDSALSHPLLPVPLPSSLGDNVDVRNLVGRLGAVTVTDYVRVHVVAQ
ncbi:MAG: hypothetical protein JSU74_06015 [Candidatus Zixiibacteriota bacterium]|nr:MAG: hypothetical protein JSU74_06015 [candidate division Zixibacteria bacterium]